MSSGNRTPHMLLIARGIFLTDNPINRGFGIEYIGLSDRHSQDGRKGKLVHIRR
jgi:hypothetical protein